MPKQVQPVSQVAARECAEGVAVKGVGAVCQPPEPFVASFRGIKLLIFDIVGHILPQAEQVL